MGRPNVTATPSMPTQTTQKGQMYLRLLPYHVKSSNFFRFSDIIGFVATQIYIHFHEKIHHRCHFSKHAPDCRAKTCHSAMLGHYMNMPIDNITSTYRWRWTSRGRLQSQTRTTLPTVTTLRPAKHIYKWP